MKGRERKTHSLISRQDCYFKNEFQVLLVYLAQALEFTNDLGCAMTQNTVQWFRLLKQMVCSPDCCSVPSYHQLPSQGPNSLSVLLEPSLYLILTLL